MATLRQGRVKEVFLWLMAVIYLFAFSSLYVQIPGLYGRNGLLPAKLVLQKGSVRVQDNFLSKPTLLWYMPYLGLDTETGMDFLCVVGMLLSLLAISLEQWRDSTMFFILWFMYFSLYQVGQTFLWFQWDILLLEAGFLAVLVAPVSHFNFAGKRCRVRNHDGVMLWLVKWLAFRLLFCSGIVKLSSQCPTWWGLTALDWHYESQCIPTPLAWYAHQLPKWFQRLSVALTYVILIGISGLFFAPVRSLRIFAFYSQIFFQVLIILTGNYNFFNLLAIALCTAVLDDAHLAAWLPKDDNPRNHEAAEERTILTGFKTAMQRITALGVLGFLTYWTIQLFTLEYSQKQFIKSKIAFSKTEYARAIEQIVPITIWLAVMSLGVEIGKALIRCLFERGLINKVLSLFQWAVFGFAALGMFSISLVPYTAIDHKAQSNLWPVIKRWHYKLDQFQIVNSYGLFRRMTGVGGRPEVIIEGAHSLAGPWKEYNFLYKPGNLEQPLPFVAPHQPRLDWQMWFAALGSYNHNPWFVHLVYRLLHGQQEVLDLMGPNPFPDKPPKFIRAQLYTYHYTELPHNTSSLPDILHNSRHVRAWWWRERDSEYLPPVTKDERSLIEWLNHHGFAKTYYEVLKENFSQKGKWPEKPSGHLHRCLLYVRSLVRRVDPLVFLMTLFSCGVLMNWIKRKSVPS